MKDPLYNHTKKLRIGIVGFGKIAKTRFLPALKKSNIAVLSAVFSRTPEKLKSENYLTGEKILKYDDTPTQIAQICDAMYISLPNHLHTEWICKCANEGLHILCEKPVSSNPEATQQCLELCHQKGVILLEAFMYRYDPRHSYTRDKIKSGYLGKIHIIEIYFSYYLEDLNNIRLSQNAQGGALMDIGCYGIDLCQFLLDEMPIDVTARCIRGEKSGVDEVTSVILSFSSGCIATITISTHLPRNNTYTVRGTHGSITVPNSFIPKSETVLLKEKLEENSEKVVEFPLQDPFETQLASFINIINKKSNLQQSEHIFRNSIVLSKAIESMGKGLKQKLF